MNRKPVIPLLLVTATMLMLAACTEPNKAPDLPDLRITSTTVSPALPVSGEPFRVTFRAFNGGSRSASASGWRISLGVTQITGTLPALGEGESSTFSHLFGATDPGQVTVTAILDTGNVVVEDDEGNNTASALVTIGAGVAPTGGG